MTFRSNLILGLIIAVAFGVRFYAIDRFATGYDELFSVLEANGLYPESVSEDVPFTKEQLNALDTPRGAVRACIGSDGGNGVLYILAMHAWTEAFGNSNRAIRLFSLIWGLLVVWLVHRLALRLFTDHRLALLAASFAALAPLLVDYSQEARAYMPATAITLLGTLQFVRLIHESRSSTGSITMYGLLIGIGLLVHYSTAYVVLGHAFFALLHVPARAWRRWLMIAAPMVAVLLGAWLLSGGLEGMRNMGRQNELYATMVAMNPDYDIFYRKATVFHLLQDVFVQLLWLGGNSLFLLGPSLRVMAMMLVLPVTLIAGLRGIVAEHRPARNLLITLALSGTAFTVLTSAISGHTFGMRYYYVMFSAPYVIILLAMGGMWWLKQGVQWKRMAGWALVAMNVCVFLISILSFYRYGYRGNDKPETVRPFAQVVTMMAVRLPHARISLIHGDTRDAIALNLHLGPAADRLPQVVDPRSAHRTVVVGSIDGRDRELLILH